MRLFLIALRFLTRIGVGPPFHPRPEELPRSVRMYPLVGLLIGGILASVYLLLVGQAVLAPGFTGALLVAIEAFLTGGLHLDGLMDVADGFFSGGDRERILAVMKDSRVGAYGVLAAVFAVLLKSGLFASLYNPSQVVLVVATPVLGRWTASLLARAYLHVGEGALGGAVIGRVERSDLLASTGFCFLALGLAASSVFLFGGGKDLFGRWLLLLAALWLLATLGGFWLARKAAARLGGITGDVVGAAVELVELLVLLAGVLVTGREGWFR
ncbi:MAG: adenosylcobinamide-GDP ribazoletransferase [Bacillota bacterium]